MLNRIVRREQEPPTPGLFDHLPELLRRIYHSRGITSARELEPTLKHLPPFTELLGISAAVELLQQAIVDDLRVVIVGDFDADGATSTALMVRVLRRFGATHVDYIVPNRFEYGYGLTPEIVEVAEKLQPDLIVTVDNGISSLEGVDAAMSKGIKILITDHHLPGQQLPAAHAIVNPNQPGCSFPSKNLAGVGVVFYLLSAVRARLRQSDWFANNGIVEPNLADYLDLVALGTVADVVKLDAINRILVEQGLRRIRAGRCQPGISALINISGRQSQRINSADLGFALGPRLNAAGRLDDMALGIECLLNDDFSEAEQQAKQLNQLNRDRREIEEGMKQEAMQDLDLYELDDLDQLPFGLCIYQPSWHQGVVGILASRIKERTHRPVIAFADAENGLIKGSARSVPGVHIRDALDAVASQNPGLIDRFGGHAMAAGLTLKQDQLQLFREAFDQEVRRHLSPNDLQGVTLSDGELNRDQFNLTTAQMLEEAGPWGQGFPEPVFDGVFEVIKRRIVGEKHLKLDLRPEVGGGVLSAIAFNYEDQPIPDIGCLIHAAYRLGVNEYRGELSAQLMVMHLDVI